MPGEIEGIGDAVTGAVVARAIEPEAGEGGGEASACLNCGVALVGDYCHQCGQRAHVHRTLTAFGHDLAHSVLHFEGKFWRTLPMLAWHPGELTRRYVAGQRARFVSPMALFLFSVFLMFAVFGILGGPFSPKVAEQPEVRADIAAERQEIEKKLAELVTERSKLAAKGASTARVDAQIVETRREAAAVETVAAAVEDGDISLNILPGQSDNWIEDAYKEAKKNPALLAYKMQANAYKFSWALIPISVPFVWLLFAFRRQYRAYDHTVFVTYSIAFMTLLVVAGSVLRATGVFGGGVIALLTLVPPLHMYRQLRGAYQLSRFAALWRTVLLVVFAFAAALTFFVLLVIIGGK